MGEAYLVAHIYIFLVLTLWDYLMQGASHTKRFTLFIVLCLVSTVSMTVSGPCKGKREMPNPRHKRLQHMNTDLLKRRLGTIMSLSPLHQSRSSSNLQTIFLMSI